MESVSRKDWKRALEAQARGDVGPFKQKNRVRGEYSIREYFNGRGRVVMRMTTHDLGRRAMGEQLFEVDPAIIAKASYIYIPTDEEYEQWNDDAQTDENVIDRKIAEKEGREYIPRIRRGPGE